MLYPGKLLFKCEDKVKIYSDIQSQKDVSKRPFFKNTLGINIPAEKGGEIRRMIQIYEK